MIICIGSLFLYCFPSFYPETKSKVDQIMYITTVDYFCGDF